MEKFIGSARSDPDLHYVLDLWFEQEVKPRLRGRAALIRYANDFVIGFEREDDARRVMAKLGKRLGCFGLTLHPDKTRLLPFRRPSAAALIALRHREGPQRVPIPGFPWIPGAFVVATLAIASFMAVREPAQAAMGMATVLLGVPLYPPLRRRLGRVLRSLGTRP